MELRLARIVISKCCGSHTLRFRSNVEPQRDEVDLDVYRRTTIFTFHPQRASRLPTLQGMSLGAWTFLSTTTYCVIKMFNVMFSYSN